MIYQTLKILALPPASLFVMILAGLLIRRWRRRTGTVLVAVGLAALYLLSMPIVGFSLLSTLERASEEASGVQESAQAIVILGAGRERYLPVRTAQTVGSLTLTRLRYGARLYRKTGLPILVTGGALRDDDAPIGELMREVLETDFLTPVKWVEKNSKTTLENARDSAALLRADDIQTIFLVTHSWHLPRATRVFEDAGLRVKPYGAGFSTMGDMKPGMFLPSARALLNSYYGIHERLGMLWYGLKASSAN